MIRLITFIFTLSVMFSFSAFAGHYEIPETDEASPALFSFIDLRDRETFVQVTNTDSVNQTVHVQIFNVDQNCNENNFFDVYTPNDTHIYNMRDILTNDGNPSGVVLPDNAYGFVVIGIVDSSLNFDVSENYLIGNFRIVDNLGYEYRTNSAGYNDSNQPTDEEWYFNFSVNNGVSLSDVILMAVGLSDGDFVAGPDRYWAMDVDILDVNENPLSCRDVTFACIDEDSPLLEETLEDSGTSVAAFEYGINEAIPHSKGGELLCPGNTIPDGWVLLQEEDNSNSGVRAHFVGLNNGNGRGSMDSMFQQNYPN